MLIDCLNHIVGLTDRDCNCFETARPSDYNTSDSGYYLTDPEHGLDLLPAVFSTTDCGDGSIWDVLQRIRNRALLDFEADLSAQIYDKNALRYSGFSGIVGKVTHTGLIFQTSPVMAQRWHSFGHRGSTAVIRRIGLGTNVAATVTVRVLNSQLDEIGTVEIETVANTLTYTTLEEPLRLDLYDQNETNGRATYYFVYDLPSNARPVNNTINCCGAKPIWTQYMDVVGMRATTESGLTTISTNTSDCNGLSVDTYMECSPMNWLCNMDVLAGYQLKSVVARTIQFRAVAKLISHVLESPQTNYYTMLGREALYGKRSHLNKRYEENILWLAENAPKNETDCLMCRDKRFKKSSILV